MFRILRVVGDSMSPEIQDGDYAVFAASPLFLRRLRPGQVVTFVHPQYGRLIKRVQRCDPLLGVYVVGAHPNSLDSRKLGWIPLTAVDGRLLWHIPRRR